MFTQNTFPLELSGKAVNEDNQQPIMLLICRDPSLNFGPNELFWGRGNGTQLLSPYKRRGNYRDPLTGKVESNSRYDYSVGWMVK